MTTYDTLALWAMISKCPNAALGADILKLFNPPQASQADLFSCPIFPLVSNFSPPSPQIGGKIGHVNRSSHVQFFPSCPIFPRPPRRLGGKLDTRTDLLMFSGTVGPKGFATVVFYPTTKDDSMRWILSAAQTTPRELGQMVNIVIFASRK